MAAAAADAPASTAHDLSTKEGRLARARELVAESRTAAPPTERIKRKAEATKDGPQKKKQKTKPAGKEKDEEKPRCRVWDITIWVSPQESAAPRPDYTKEWVRDWMIKCGAKRYVYQIEKSPENGHLHFQCRVHLGKDQQYATVFDPLPQGAWLTPTSKAAKDNFTYVMKEETRVEGPWTDVTYAKPPNEIVNDTDYEYFLPEWYLKLKKEIDIEFNQRMNNRWLKRIFWVYDKGGGKAKTRVKNILRYFKGYINIVPLFNNVAQLGGQIVAKTDKLTNKDFSGIVIDLPRAAELWKLDKKCELYEVLELARNGESGDPRNRWQEARFGSIPIVVFANYKPRSSDFTKGRLYLCDISGIPENPPLIDIRTLGTTPQAPTVEDVPDFRGDPSQRRDRDGISEEEMQMAMEMDHEEVDEVDMEEDDTELPPSPGDSDLGEDCEQDTTPEEDEEYQMYLGAQGLIDLYCDEQE